MRVERLLPEGKARCGRTGWKPSWIFPWWNTRQPGDHLIIHAGYAIEILDSAEAAERLRLFDEAGAPGQSPGLRLSSASRLPQLPASRASPCAAPLAGGNPPVGRLAGPGSAHHGGVRHTYRQHPPGGPALAAAGERAPAVRARLPRVRDARRVHRSGPVPAGPAGPGPGHLRGHAQGAGGFRRLAGLPAGSGGLRILYSPAGCPPGPRRGPPGGLLGVGFETTAPQWPRPSSRRRARESTTCTFSPRSRPFRAALRALLLRPGIPPGRLPAAGTRFGGPGPGPYRFLEEPGGLPGAVTGFEPLDMLGAPGPACRLSDLPAAGPGCLRSCRVARSR